MNVKLILILGSAAIAAYVFHPGVHQALAPVVEPLLGRVSSALFMKLDPGLSDAIDDRRGGGGGGLTRTGGPGGEEGGGFPRGGGPGGGMDDDGPGRGGGRMGPPGGFPGGRGGPGGFPGGGGRGGGLRCRDTQTGQDVPLSFCEREHGGRR